MPAAQGVVSFWEHSFEEAPKLHRRRHPRAEMMWDVVDRSETFWHSVGPERVKRRWPLPARTVWTVFKWFDAPDGMRLSPVASFRDEETATFVAKGLSKKIRHRGKPYVTSDLRVLWL